MWICPVSHDRFIAALSAAISAADTYPKQVPDWAYGLDADGNPKGNGDGRGIVRP